MNVWIHGFKRRFAGFPDEDFWVRAARFFPRLVAVLLRADYWIDRKRGTDFWPGTNECQPVRTWNRLIDLVGDGPRGDVRVFVIGDFNWNEKLPDRPLPKLKKHAQLLLIPTKR